MKIIIRSILFFPLLLFSSLLPKTPPLKPNNPCIFKSLAGEHDENACWIREELKNFKKNLEEPSRTGKPFYAFNSWIFFGPHGTGKTTLAKAIAEESGASLHYHHGSEINVDYDSPTAGPYDNLLLVKEAYEEAQKTIAETQKPVVIVFDGIDHFTNDAIGALRAEIDNNKNNPLIMTILIRSKRQGLDPALRSRCWTIDFYRSNHANRRAILEQTMKSQNHKPSNLSLKLLTTLTFYASAEDVKNLGINIANLKNNHAWFAHSRGYLKTIGQSSTMQKNIIATFLTLAGTTALIYFLKQGRVPHWFHWIGK